MGKKKILLKQRKYTGSTLERHNTARGTLGGIGIPSACELIAFPFIGATNLAELEPREQPSEDLQREVTGPALGD